MSGPQVLYGRFGVIHATGPKALRSHFSALSFELYEVQIMTIKFAQRVKDLPNARVAYGKDLFRHQGKYFVACECSVAVANNTQEIWDAIGECVDAVHLVAVVSRSLKAKSQAADRQFLADACLEWESRQDAPGPDLIVETLGSKHLEIREARPDQTIKSLKTIIRALDGTPEHMQTLIFQGEELLDDRLVADYHIKRGSTLYLVLRLRGGMVHASSFFCSNMFFPLPLEGQKLYVQCASAVGEEWARSQAAVEMHEPDKPEKSATQTEGGGSSKRDGGVNQPNASQHFSGRHPPHVFPTPTLVTLPKFHARSLADIETAIEQAITSAKVSGAASAKAVKSNQTKRGGTAKKPRTNSSSSNLSAPATASNDGAAPLDGASVSLAQQWAVACGILRKGERTWAQTRRLLEELYLVVPGQTDAKVQQELDKWVRASQA